MSWKTEVIPIQMWKRFAIAGSVASVCSVCGRFAGDACDKCGGESFGNGTAPLRHFGYARSAAFPILLCTCHPVPIRGAAVAASRAITAGRLRSRPPSAAAVDLADVWTAPARSEPGFGRASTRVEVAIWGTAKPSVPRHQREATA